MKLISTIKKSNNMTVHGIGAFSDGEPSMLSKDPEPKNLVIEERMDGVFLFYLDSNGEIVSDTWHASIDKAMAQAAFEFGIKTEDWAPID